MQNNFLYRKSSIFFISLFVTFLFLSFSVPHFIEKEKIEEQVKRLKQVSFDY